MADKQGRWRVVRQDDNGNRFVVADGVTEGEAVRCAEELTARGHKQAYWAEPMADEEQPAHD